MRKILIYLLILGLLLGCIYLQNPVSKEEIESFSITYDHNSEKEYKSLKILGTGYLDLTFLPIDTLNSDACQKPDLNTNCYRINYDLANTWYYPSETEIVTLINQIKDSGFMDYDLIDSNYILNGGKYYAYTITIKLKDKEKTLIYKSYPGAEKKPEQFKKVEELLISLINKTCLDNIETIC